MDYLEKKNSHERDSHITFDEGPHIYTIDGDSSFQSVTQYIHGHFPKFNQELVLDKVMNSKNKTKKYGDMTREEIRKSWSDNGKKASADGTFLHECIECYYNKCPRKNDSIEYKYFLDFVSKYPELIPYRTEWMVYDKEAKLAGSIDMIYENKDGTLSIYDWKRVKELKKTNGFDEWALTPEIDYLPHSNYWHYSLQLNMYKRILEKNYGKKIKELYLVCLHPNNKRFLRVKVKNLDNEIDILLNKRIKLKI